MTDDEQFAQLMRGAPRGGAGDPKYLGGLPESPMQALGQNIQSVLPESVKLPLQLGASVLTSPRIMPQAAAEFAATYGGELYDQRQEGAVDHPAALREAAGSALLTVGAGGLFKMGDVFRVLFPKKEGRAGWEKAVEYAKQQGLVAPLSWAKGKALTLGRGSFLGEWVFAKQLGKFNEAITNHILTAGGRIGDLPTVMGGINKAKESIGAAFNKRAGFGKVMDVVGADTVVNMTAFYTRLPHLLDEMQLRPGSNIRKELEQMVAHFQASGSDVLMPFKEVDDLIQDLYSAAGKSSSGREMAERAKEIIYNVAGKQLDEMPHVRSQLASLSTAEGRVTVPQLMEEAQQSFARITKALKQDKRLKQIIQQGNLSDKQFLVAWSESKAARDVIKELDPAAWMQMNEAWVSQRLNGFLRQSDTAGNKVVRPEGLKFVDWITTNKDEVLDMFGDEGFEGLKNLGYWMEYTKDYAQMQTGTSSGRMARLQGMAIGAGGAGYLGGPFASMGALAANEALGPLLVNMVMNPNNAINKVGKAVTDVGRHVPSGAVGGPLGTAGAAQYDGASHDRQFEQLMATTEPQPLREDTSMKDLFRAPAEGGNPMAQRVLDLESPFSKRMIDRSPQFLKPPTR